MCACVHQCVLYFVYCVNGNPMKINKSSWISISKQNRCVSVVVALDILFLCYNSCMLTFFGINNRQLADVLFMLAKVICVDKISNHNIDNFGPIVLDRYLLMITQFDSRDQSKNIYT